MREKFVYNLKNPFEVRKTNGDFEKVYSIEVPANTMELENDLNKIIRINARATANASKEAMQLMNMSAEELAEMKAKMDSTAKVIDDDNQEDNSQVDDSPLVTDKEIQEALGLAMNIVTHGANENDYMIALQALGRMCDGRAKFDETVQVKHDGNWTKLSTIDKRAILGLYITNFIFALGTA